MSHRSPTAGQTPPSSHLAGRQGSEGAQPAPLATAGGSHPTRHTRVVGIPLRPSTDPSISCPRPSPGRVNSPGVPLWRNVMSGLD